MKPFLIVIWCQDLAANQEFYQALGFNFEQQQHEGHDPHFAAQLADMVLELHQCPEDMTASNNRLGFVIDNSVENYQQVLSEIAERASTTYDMGDGQFYSVVSDPDGRSIELVYQK